MKEISTTRGVLSPVVTPFGADLSPDGDRFVGHCRWLMSNGVALAVFGTNSEANSLAVGETLALTRRAGGHRRDGGPDDAGHRRLRARRFGRLTAPRGQAGCAGVLMLPPFYYKGVSDEGLFRNFAEVIERVGDERAARSTSITSRRCRRCRSRSR